MSGEETEDNNHAKKREETEDSGHAKNTMSPKTTTTPKPREESEDDNLSHQERHDEAVPQFMMRIAGQGPDSDGGRALTWSHSSTARSRKGQTRSR